MFISQQTLSILNDLVTNQPEHPQPYTQQQIVNEFESELQKFELDLISETELYEIICESIDRHNF